MHRVKKKRATSKDALLRAVSALPSPCKLHVDFFKIKKNNLMNLTIDKRVIEKASETSCMFNAVRCMCSFSG